MPSFINNYIFHI